MRRNKTLNYLSIAVAVLALGYFINRRIISQHESNLAELKVESPIWSTSGSSKYTLYLAPTKEVSYKLYSFGPAVSSRRLVYDSSVGSRFIEADFLQNRRQISIWKKQNGETITMGFAKNKHALFIGDHRRLEDIEHLDIHDVIHHQDGSVTIIRYIPDLDNDLLHLGIDTISTSGQVIWSWTSKGLISADWNVSAKKSSDLSLEYFIIITRDYFSRILYNWFPTFAREILSWDSFPKSLIVEKQGLRSLSDYVHANSIQFIDNNQKILVSARNLDTIFTIDVITKRSTWALGGNFSLMTQNRPTGDPRNGFSHQHTARIFNNRLYIFDNANLYSLPSRVVVYKVDEKNLNSAEFLYEYLEPNRLTRTTMGSIQPLDKYTILIGWGGIGSANLSREVTAAASIIDIKRNRSLFQMNFKPGYSSYQVFAEVK